MPIFTAPDGSPVEIDARTVARISRTVRSDLDGASSRIDGNRSDLVRESVPEVLELLSIELSSLVKLTGASGQSIWVNAKLVEGPFPPRTDAQSKGYGCHIIVAGEEERLMEDEETVARLLKQAGGSA